MIKYGLISDTDARTLEKTIDLICEDLEGINVCVTEVGCYGGDTGKGVLEYILSKNKTPLMIGIDNNKDAEPLRYPYDKFICGKSNEVYNQLEDESQHLIFFDGGHAYPTVIADWYCYKNKIKYGGYAAFHDCSPQAQGKDWQRMGSEQDPDMSISVVKALAEIGLLNEWKREPDVWELIFNEFDHNDNAGGIMVFKRIG